jgi:hypothetical protein
MSSNISRRPIKAYRLVNTPQSRAGANKPAAYALISLLDIVISRVILSPVFTPRSSYSLVVILKVVDPDDILFLSPRNAPSIASDIFFGKFFKSSNEVIGMAATPKGFSGNPCCLLVEVKSPLVSVNTT